MATALRTLRIRLLGTFSLTYSDGAVAGVTTPRLQSLLAYLILHRDTPQLRQHLAFQFWPDATEAQARNNLRQALHALRLAFPDPDTFLTSDASIIQWRLDAPYSLDVDDLERALAVVASAQPADLPSTAEAVGPERGAALRDALLQVADLYHADLLPSCYDEWIAPERDRLRQRCLRALAQLAALRERDDDLPAAIAIAQQILQHDPLDEEAYRRLMRLLARNDDRAGAIRVYHTGVDTLRRELGIEPSHATRDVYERLTHVNVAASAPRQSAPVAGDEAHGTPQSLVGRRRDWERLLGAWDRARAGGPALALITGEAGIGKSRLAEDLLASARRQAATTAKARCYAAEGRLSLAPATDWLRAEGLRPHLLRLSPVWLTEVSRVLPELTAEHPGLPPYEPMTEYGQRRRFFEALARAVFAAPQPLLLLIDDLQWCDEETLEWLHFLLRFDPSAHLLVVGTARAEDLSPRHPLRSLLLHLGDTVAITEIALQPLDAGETARLAEQIAHRELSTAAAMRLYRETEGNPLFVVETMRAGVEALSSADAPLPIEAGDPASPNALPPRVRAVIAGRLAQLTPETRDLCALAAAAGRAFRLDVLAHAAGASEDVAVRALDELWQRRIVREQDANTYDFTHDKLREVAYAEISAPQRRLLHRRIAQALETVHAADHDAVSAQIAAHFDRAGLAEQAIPYYQRTAAVAQRVYANEDAIAALTRALALLQQLPAGRSRDARELALLMALAPIYRITRGWTAPELEGVIQRALALCDTVGTDDQRAEALYSFESMLVVQAKLERVLQIDAELHAVYAHIGRAAPFSGVMLAGVQQHVGRLAEANDAFERMFAAQDPALSRAELDLHGWNDAVLGRAWQSHALWCLGYPDRALTCGREALQIASDLELPFNHALAATYLALLQQLRADPVTAREQAQAAYELTVQYKAPYYRVWASILLRYAEAWEQPDAEHVALLRRSMDEFTSSGARLRLPYYLGLLARLNRRAGRLDDGLAAIDEALAESHANGERWWDAELYRLRAELLRARDADDQAEPALVRALEIARAQGAKSLELRAAMSLARLWRSHRRAADARQLLSDIFGWFTEGFDSADLRRARSLLDRLA